MRIVIVTLFARVNLYTIAITLSAQQFVPEFLKFEFHSFA